MKLVITGSLGNISKPLTEALVQAGHAVTVVSSQPARQAEIEALGAVAAIGVIEDVAFLTRTFRGADAVYCMLPRFKFLENPNLDTRAEALKIATYYGEAIRASGVKRVVHLSSIGAHLEKGNGLLAFHFIAEQKLRELLPDVAITHMRPVGFYYNLNEFMDAIRGKGFLSSFIGQMLTIRYYGLVGFMQGKRGLIMSNYGGADKMPWVSPIDIATDIADEITKPAQGIHVRYVASEVLTCSEIATTIGTAVGKPYLKWETITDKQMLSAFKQFKMPLSLATDLVEMNASMRNGGILFEDYYRHEPTLGKTKLATFAKEFAVTYHKG